MVTHGTRFGQVHATQHLGTHHLHLPICLDEQSCIGRQGRQGLLTQQLSVGSLAGGPFRHQSIATFHQSRPARRAEALFQSLQLLDHGIEQLIPVVQQQAQTFPFRLQLLEFLTQAFLFQTSQPSQWHGQNGVSLAFTQIEAHHQAGSRRSSIASFLNHRDHCLKVVQRGDQAVDHFKAVFRFAQSMAGAPDQGQFPVIQEGLQQLA